MKIKLSIAALLVALGSVPLLVGAKGPKCGDAPTRDCVLSLAVETANRENSTYRDLRTMLAVATVQERAGDPGFAATLDAAFARLHMRAGDAESWYDALTRTGCSRDRYQLHSLRSRAPFVVHGVGVAARLAVELEHASTTVMKHSHEEIAECIGLAGDRNALTSYIASIAGEHSAVVLEDNVWIAGARGLLLSGNDAAALAILTSLSDDRSVSGIRAGHGKILLERGDVAGARKIADGLPDGHDCADLLIALGFHLAMDGQCDESRATMALLTAFWERDLGGGLPLDFPLRRAEAAEIYAICGDTTNFDATFAGRNPPDAA